MKRLTIALVLLLVLPAVAQADWAKPWEREYLNAYERAHDRGHPTGRNLLDHHWKPRANRVPRQRVEESTARLKRWLSPPPPVAAPAPSTSESSASEAAPSRGSVIPEAIVQCESGGDYNAVNPSSGAYGKYQIMPGHWGSWGTCTDLDRSPAGQDACAGRIWQESGSSAWVCAG